MCLLGTHIALMHVLLVAITPHQGAHTEGRTGISCHGNTRVSLRWAKAPNNCHQTPTFNRQQPTRPTPACTNIVARIQCGAFLQGGDSKMWCISCGTLGCNIEAYELCSALLNFNCILICWIWMVHLHSAHSKSANSRSAGEHKRVFANRQLGFFEILSSPVQPLMYD